MFEATNRLFYRIVSALGVPPAYFVPVLESQTRAFDSKQTILREKGSEPIKLEIVSHCWKYSKFLVYQLSSLKNFPPTELKVKMTVFFSNKDSATRDLLDYFEKFKVPNLEWNWQELPKELLLRRAIGRNKAALETDADWIWFTDCDLLFLEGCLDALSNVLEESKDILLFPRQEHRTQILAPNDELLNLDTLNQVVSIERCQFETHSPGRATGPLQITRGDVARALGYCNSLKAYQQPARHWSKAREDGIFRWILQTEGFPIDIPSVFRIRHEQKGRYSEGTLYTELRTLIRKVQGCLKDTKK